jgi:hypothetical protein
MVAAHLERTDNKQENNRFVDGLQAVAEDESKRHQH